jgi:hypothetical protein
MRDKESRAELYDKLVDAFRAIGKPHFAEVALLSGASASVAKKAWEQGFTTQGKDVFPPIRDMFLGEKVKARATRAKLHAKLMDRTIKGTEMANEDAALSAALEGLIARSAMMAADDIIGQVKTLAQALKPLAESLANDLYGMATDKEVPTAMKVSYVTNLTKVFKDAIDVVEKAQRIEGKFLGRPDLRIDISDSPDNVDDAIRSIMNAYAALATAKGLPQPETITVSAEPIEVSKS